ncbi:GntR family transcriptional regulator [Paenibacillus sp. CF384]|uniref:GntR family transcriptional regulator n=1 Tax=Paenibacillus sp. CF384 TaxID=1884382 RepID=UPI000898A9F1|nr:GntR family transcriptional regulator [Paenibacillus sp. CF384]SDW81784.1 LacI family transcriptional regulator [Paenibacillus sp. CF384]
MIHLSYSQANLVEMKVNRLTTFPYHRIKEDIRKRIHGGEWRDASRLPSSRNLAESYQSSVNTIEKAIKELCGEGLLTRDNRRGTYLADGGLLSLPISRIRGENGKGSGLIAASVIGIDNPLWGAALRGIEDVLQPKGYQLMSSSDNRSLDKLESFVASAIARQVEGIILSPIHGGLDEPRSRQIYEKLAGCGIPVIFLDRRVWDTDIPFVTSDNASGAYSLTKLLLAKGHRRIAFVRNSDLSTFYERLLGMRQAFIEAGVSYEAEYDLCIPTRFENFESEFEDFVARLAHALDTKRYTAVFAANDQIAEAALAALERLGKRVPDEMSLVTYDAQGLNGKLRLDLTGANQPFYDMGRSAAIEIVHAAEGKQPIAVAGHICKADIHYGSSVWEAKIE